MIRLDRSGSIRQRIARCGSLLPQPLAYPLIFAVSVFLWSLIGVAIGGLLRRCAP